MSHLSKSDYVLISHVLDYCVRKGASKIQLEMRVSQMDDYRRIAFFHHLIFTKEEVRMRNRGNYMDVETA